MPYTSSYPERGDFTSRKKEGTVFGALSGENGIRTVLS
jgi:hypothetical protein